MRTIKQLFIIFLLICNLHPQAQKQLFTTRWQFHKGDIAEGANNRSDSITWRSVNLPHDWSIEGPFSEEWASATAFLPGGIGWYKKTFRASKSCQAKNIFIYFDGVYKNSTVWLNGHYLGNRPNGFIPFEYELTKYLNYNEENTLAVKVDHSEFADSRWYTGSGIYRNVYLVVKEPVHIANWGVRFTTPVINKESADANVKVILIDAGRQKALAIIKGSLKDNNGNVVASATKAVNVNVADSGLANLSFTVKHPKLWSIDEPYLYTLIVSVAVNDKTVDKYIEKTGIRKIKIDAGKGFFLNDESVKLKGVCIHDDAGVFGGAVPEAVWRMRLRLLKEMGCNSLRMSHNPHADYMYKLCDEMGFLVIDEAFDEWEAGKNKWIKGWNVGTPGKDGYHEYFSRWADIDLRDMILRNYNHPSIIAWSIGNEIDYPNDPYSSEILSSGNNPQIYGKGYLPGHPPASRLSALSQQLSNTVKQYDTTRPVTAALAGVVMSNTTSYPDNLDWVGYNYQEFRYADDHTKYPNRKIYGSENGMQLKAWNAVDSNEYIPGQYLWTGIDYLGEAGKWPQRSNGAGLLDLAGFKKPEYYFRQSLWSNKPMIYIGATPVPKEEDKGIWSHKQAEPNWNWKEGDKLRINCFTNCGEAELFLNGKSSGKKAMDGFPGHVIYWDVGYAAGELKVVGYNNNKQAAGYSLRTSGEPYALKAVVEKDTPGRSGLVHVSIFVVDKRGITINSADNEVTVLVKGNGSLLGLESGSSTSHEDYRSNKRKAVHGKLMAYVMRNKGAAIIEINSPGLLTSKSVLK
ncbi:MAG: sugar-binding domain-containing protein [Ginsengibacter sp.]